jgi:hypothetical protein
MNSTYTRHFRFTLLQAETATKVMIPNDPQCLATVNSAHTLLSLPKVPPITPDAPSANRIRNMYATQQLICCPCRMDVSKHYCSATLSSLAILCPNCTLLRVQRTAPSSHASVERVSGAQRKGLHGCRGDNVGCVAKLQCR